MTCSKIEILCTEIHIVLLTVQTVSKGRPGFVRVLGRLSELLVLVLGRLKVLPVCSGYFVCVRMWEGVEHGKLGEHMVGKHRPLPDENIRELPILTV